MSDDIWLLCFVLLSVAIIVLPASAATSSGVGPLEFRYQCNPSDCSVGTSGNTVSFYLVDGYNSHVNYPCPAKFAWKGTFENDEGSPYSWEEGKENKQRGSLPKPIPPQTYQHPGKYTLKLTTPQFSLGNCGGTYTDTLTITDNPPVAKFTTTPGPDPYWQWVAGPFPFLVHFKDISTGNPTNRKWELIAPENYLHINYDDFNPTNLQEFDYKFLNPPQIYVVKLHVTKTSQGKILSSDAGQTIIVLPET